MFDKIFNRPQYIPWDKFFKIEAEDIVHFKIIPDKTVQNNTQVLARAMHEFYNAPKDRIIIDIRGIKVTYQIKDKAHFDIIFRPGQAHFYLSVPRKWAKFMELKMKNIWSRCAIQEVPRAEMSDFDPGKCRACDLRLRRHNMFSLKTSTRDLDPLNGLFAILKDLSDEEEERVRISFVFDSINRLDWQNTIEDAYTQYKKGNMPKRAQVTRQDMWQALWKGAEYLMSWYIELRMMIIDGVIGFMGTQETDEDKIVKALERVTKSKDIEIKRIEAEGGLSPETLRKLKAPTFNTYVRIISQSNRPENRNINMRTAANAFKDITGDNELHMVELPDKTARKRMQQIMNFKATPRFDKDVCSDEEVAKFIQLPQITLQQEYKIDSIETREIDLPEELKSGTIPQGMARLRGKDFPVYWNDRNHDIFALPKVWEGFSRSGKTTGLKNFIIDTLNQGYWNLVVDVNEGDLVDDVIRFAGKSIPPDKFKIFDFNDINTVFRLGLTELIGSNAGDREAEKAMSAVADVLGYFLDSTNAEPLTDRMKRYFVSGIRMCLTNGYAGIKDFRRILEDHIFRCELIERSRGIMRDKVIEDMETLNKIDGRNGSITGTREDLIAGILDRMDILTRTDLLEDTFMHAPNPEINFRKWADEGCFIGIKCNKSGKEEAVNILVTFLIEKMWCAILTRQNIRGQHGGYDRNLARLGFITLDEPHSFPTVCRILTGAIRESAKWRAGFNFAVHDLNDLGILLPKLKAAGGSFMIYQTSKDNYIELSDIMGDFSIAEAQQTKQYHSLNIINWNGERIVYDVLNMPPPDRRFKEIKRPDLYELNRKRYGTNYRELYYKTP
jgi:hypothetical protein